jgi:diguanylate cyclase (GGDEF)-like protein
MTSDWSMRAFTAWDRAAGAASLLLSDDLVVRWASSSFVRMFGHDPVGSSALDLLHPEDLPFALSVLELHVTNGPYDGEAGLDDVMPPSGEVRVRSATGDWTPTVVRIDNHLDDPDIGALAVYASRAADQSGLSLALDAIGRAAPVDETLLAVLDYIVQDSVQPIQDGTAVVRFDEDGGRHIVSHADPRTHHLLFGDEAIALERSANIVTITLVKDMPDGPMRRCATERGLSCLWAVHVGEPGKELGIVLCWSAWSFAMELRPHMHFSIGSDVVRLALHESRRLDALRRHATIDPLTGVYNRAGLTEAFVTLNAQDPSCVGAVFIDLDDFKLVNDAHGHSVGDQVLAEVAARLQEVVRAGDVVARVGGDEFVLVCIGVDPSVMQSVADRVERAFALDVPTDAGWLSIKASVGTSSLTEPDDLATLLRSADDEQYRVKRMAKLADRT